MPLAIGITYKAIDTGQVDTFDAFTTDAQLTSGKYVLLADPKRVFGFQNVAPIVKKSVLAAEGPAFAADDQQGQLAADACRRSRR